MRNEEHTKKAQQQNLATSQGARARGQLGADGQMGVGQVMGRRAGMKLPKAEPPPHTMNVVQEGRNEPIIPKTVGPAGSFVEQNNPPKDLTMIPGIDEKRAGAIAQAGSSEVHGSDDPNNQNLPQNLPANKPAEIEETDKNPNPVLPGQVPAPEQKPQTPGQVGQSTGDGGRTASAPQATPRDGGDDHKRTP